MGYLRLITAALILQTVWSSCPKTWVQYRDSCYFFNEVSWTWDEAADICRNRQGQLTSHATQEELDFVTSETSKRRTDFWFGLKRVTFPNGTSGWQYNDGTTFNPGITNWDRDQPSGDQNAACVFYRGSSHKWANAQCQQVKGYICKRDAVIEDKCNIDEGWHPIKDKCYKYYEDMQTFTDARATCQRDNGDLIVINSTDKLRILRDKITCSDARSSVWIGLTDMFNPSDFYWVDGSRLTITNWDLDQPQRSSFGDNCVEAVSTRQYKWRVLKCNYQRKFICERDQGQCQDGWRQFRGHCYQVHVQSSMKKTWTDAADYCSAQTAELISIRNQDEQTFFTGILSDLQAGGRKYTWIGLSDRGDINNGPFLWTDGTNITYSNWHQGQPVNRPRRMDCGLVVTNDQQGNWSTQHCFHTQSFTCKIPLYRQPRPAQPQPNEYSCPEGWEVVEHLCYKFYDVLTKQGAAQSNCSAQGANLAIVDTPKQQSFMADKVRRNTWFGLVYQRRNRRWGWVGGHPLSPNFQNWAFRHPQSGKNCGYLRGNQGRDHWRSMWMSDKCDKRYAFVCSKDAVHNSAPTQPPITVKWWPQCGWGWSYDPVANFCYRVMPARRRWPAAQRDCRNNGGNLASIHSPHEQAFVAAVLQTNPVGGSANLWIGANNRNQNAGWRWSDGTPFNFVYWRSGSPARRGRRYCVALSPGVSSGWHNQRCRRRFAFICKKLPSDAPTPITPVPITPPADCPARSLLSGENRLQDELFSASTFDPQHPPSMARLNYVEVGSLKGGWIPKGKNPDGAWLRVDFYFPILIKGVATQGCPDQDAWVTKYNLQFQYQELTIWRFYRDGRAIKAFDGNTDRNTVVNQNVTRAFEASSIRMFPTEWNTKICVRWEIYGCRTSDCDKELAVSSDHFVPDTSLTASSSLDDNYGPEKARLHLSNPGAWIPSSSDNDRWIQVDLGQTVRITDVQTQGIPDGSGWVTRYKVKYSYNGERFDDFQEPDNVTKVFPANTDSTGKANNSIGTTLLAQHIRLYPSSWNHRAALRFDVGICLPGCQPIALIDPSHRPLPDDSLSASSSRNNDHGPHRSRINTRSQGRLAGGWSALTNDQQQFIQVSLPSVYYIRAIATRGRQDADEWVTSYRLTYSIGGTLWINHTEKAQPAVYEANWDRDTLRKIYIRSPFSARHVRLIPVTWQNHISLRWEVYGCAGIMTGNPIGCFEDVRGSPDLPFEIVNNPPGGMTIDFCLSHCFHKDYVYAGLRNGTWCSCGDSYGRYGPYPICQVPCSGDPMSTCGGVSANKVWSTGIEFSSMRCAEGFRPYEGKCYMISDKVKMSWYDAQKACRALRGDLATINSPAEQDFIFSYMGDIGVTQRLWIGLAAMKRRMSFEWSDGSPVLYTNWARLEPNAVQDDEDCVHMHAHSGQWNDHRCPLAYGYVCQSKPSVIQLPTTPGPHDGCLARWSGYRWSCYLFITQWRTWRSADNACKTFGGYLVRVDDRYEQSFLSSELRHRRGEFWTDLSDQLTPGMYHWSDGNTNIPFTNWGPGQPSIVNGSCVAMATGLGGGVWYDRNCRHGRPYICEKPRDGYTTPLPPQPTADSVYCPPGTIRWGANCFNVRQPPVVRRQGWYYALDDCRNMGADLASFHNDTEMTDIWRFGLAGTRRQFWIGLNRMNDKGGYEWSDGTSVAYLNWDNNEPRAEGQCAFVMARTGKWRTASDCSNGKQWICKSPAGYILRNTSTTPPPTPGPAGSCSPDNDEWKFYNGRCYYVSKNTQDERLTWRRAEDWCNSQSATLASMHSEEEKNFVWGQLKQRAQNRRSFWIGLNELDSKDGWKWSDTSPVVYTNWGPGEPNDHGGEENCVNMRNEEGFWNDAICSFEFQFVCAKRPGSFTFPTTPPPTPRPGSCPLGWFRFEDRCFIFLGLETLGEDPGPQNWTSAREFCKKQQVVSGDLASITDTREQAFLTSRMQFVGKPLWIGLMRKNRRGRFYWIDNSDVVFTNWARGEPTRRRERNQCVFMQAFPAEAGQWKNAPCNQEIGFLCQGLVSPQQQTPPPTPRVCDVGWTLYGLACYQISSSVSSWQQAEQQCVQQGAHLVSVNSRFEEAHLITMVTAQPQTDPVWIGLSDTQTPGEYRWTDQWPVLYVNWDKDQPTTPGGQSSGCTHMLRNGRWSVQDCSGNKRYICKKTNEKPPYQPPVTGGTCPDEPRDLRWVKHGRHCYLFVSKRSVTHAAAQHQCNMAGSTLVSIHSSDETKFLTAHMQMGPGGATWIGLIRTRTEGFAWRDGSPFQYSNWDKGMPEDKNGTLRQNCAEMTKYGMWRDVICNTRDSYICKLQQSGLQPPATTRQPPGGSTRSRPPGRTQTRTMPATRWTFPGLSSTKESIGNTNPPNTRPRLGAGGIVGICIAVLVVLVAVIVVVFHLVGKRRPQKDDMVELNNTFDNPVYSAFGPTEEAGGLQTVEPTFNVKGTAASSSA